MSEPRFYALREEACRAFGRRVAAMCANNDLDEWAKLYAVLTGLRREPYLGDDGRLRLDAEPLVRLEWHLSPGPNHAPLSPDELPSPDSEAFRDAQGHDARVYTLLSRSANLDLRRDGG